MVRQAKLRSAVAEIQSYNVALTTFKLEYNGVAGDFNRATSYWGGGVTSDGNGNGIVRPYQTEGYWAWQHLALAEIIPGSYAGVQQGVNTIGSAVPKSSFPNSGYGFISGSRANYFWTGKYSQQVEHFIRWGGLYLAGTNTRIGRIILTVKEAKAIDDKMDDGLPGLGRYVIQLNSSPNCVTTNVTTTSLYDLSNQGVQCYFNYVWEFRR